MQALKQKQKQKLQEYKVEINNIIKKEQSQMLYHFTVLNIPFIDDFHISYDSDTNSLSEAQDFGDILVAGAKDLINIVAENALGIKDYNLLEEESQILSKFHDALDEQYPTFVEFKVEDRINVKIKKMQTKQKIDTIYYKKLCKLKQKITIVRKALNKRYAVKSNLRALTYKFIKIDIAIAMTIFQDIPAYSEIERLEEEAREICNKLIKSVQKYDRSVQKLHLLD